MSTEAETYTMELHKVSGLVPETLNLLSLWQPGMSAAELRDQATRSNALAKASASRVKDIVMEGFAKRYLRPDERPAASLKAFLAAGARLPQLRQLFLLHTLRNQAILRDYLLKVYWPCVQAGRDRVEKAESMQFLRDAFDSERIPGKWSQPTIDRVTQGIFKCLEDFGLFVKRRADSRDIADFHVSPLTVLYIAYDAHFSGIGDTAVLALADWQWLGMSSQDVVTAYRMLAASTSTLIFQYSGDLVRFTFPWDTMKELADAYLG